MSFSRVQIYNLALSNIGSSIQLQSTEGTDPSTIALNNYYMLALEQLLKDFDWNFAIAYRDLALTSNGKSINPLYEYEFEYPADCMSAKEIVSADPSTNIDFEVASNYTTGTRVINTNVQYATLRYTRRVDKEAFFPAEFVSALSWYLSFLICDIVGLSAKKENAMKIYSSLARRAMNANAYEGFEDKEEDASWIRKR